MIKKSCLVILLLLLGAAMIQGLPTNGDNQCFCRGSRRTVNPARIDRVQYHRPSSSCDQEELVVTFKDGNQICLSLNSVQGRKIKQAIMQK